MLSRQGANRKAMDDTRRAAEAGQARKATDEKFRVSNKSEPRAMYEVFGNSVAENNNGVLTIASGPPGCTQVVVGYSEAITQVISAFRKTFRARDLARYKLLKVEDSKAKVEDGKANEILEKTPIEKIPKLKRSKVMSL